MHRQPAARDRCGYVPGKTSVPEAVQKQTLTSAWAMSALPPKADIGTQSRNVRFVPILLQKSGMTAMAAGANFFSAVRSLAEGLAPLPPNSAPLMQSTLR
jgi:hypothetical protein